MYLDIYVIIINKICKALFVNLRLLYVTDMHYLEPEVYVSFYYSREYNNNAVVSAVSSVCF